MTMKLRAFFTPPAKVWAAILVVAVAANIAGKILSPNGPSGGLRGFFGGLAMGIFFVLVAYLAVSALVWAARVVQKRRIAPAD